MSYVPAGWGVTYPESDVYDPDDSEPSAYYEIGDKVVDVVYDQDKSRGVSPVYTVIGVIYELKTPEGKTVLYRSERLRLSS